VCAQLIREFVAGRDSGKAVAYVGVKAPVRVVGTRAGSVAGGTVDRGKAGP
jgi:hypothetical protein